MPSSPLHHRLQRPAPAFRPLPLLENPHVQTILASVLPRPALPYPTFQRIVVLPDGDRMVLHETTPPHWQPGGITAVLVHGMGGCHRSGYLARLARWLLPHRIRVARLDLRGAGSGALLAKKIYNGACSADIRVVLAAIRAADPHARIVLVGFSLGGNIVLRLAGEAAAAPVPGLEAVAAIAPPIDMEGCSSLIRLPRNRFYDRHFVDVLIRQVQSQQRTLPRRQWTRFPARLTLRDFDDLYTAPRGGYRDVADYYASASAFPLVSGIEVPTFVLTARDDPFIAVAPFEALPARDQCLVEIVDQGGHLGFLGWNGAGGIRWVERRLARWILCERPGAR